MFAVCFVALVIISKVNSANILAITAYPSLRYTAPFVQLFQNLLEDHNVTLITSIPNLINPNKFFKNQLRVIDLSEVYKHPLPSTFLEMVTGYTIDKHNEIFRIVIQHPEVRDLIINNEHYDIMMCDITSPIWTVIGNRFNIPIIGLLPTDLFILQMHIGNSNNVAVNADMLISRHTGLTLLEKITNLYQQIIILIEDLIYTHNKIHFYLEEYFPQLENFSPSASFKNISIVFINDILGFHTTRATYENAKFIGGGQKISEGQSASEIIHFEELILIYLENHSDDVLIQLINDTQQIPAQFAWVDHPGLNSTMKTVITNSNNIKLFHLYELDLQNRVKMIIANGDNFIIELSLYYGIPLILIPVTIEDNQNAEKLLKENLSKVLPSNATTTEYKLLVEDMLSIDDNYKDSIKKYSKSIEAPLSGMKTAIIWTNWLINHREQFEHLSAIASPTARLNIIEFWYFDIILLITLSILLGSIILIFLGLKSMDYVTEIASNKELVY